MDDAPDGTDPPDLADPPDPSGRSGPPGQPDASAPSPTAGDSGPPVDPADPPPDASGPGPRTASLWRRGTGPGGRRIRRAARSPEAGAPADGDDTPPFGRRRHHRVAVVAVAVLVAGALVASLFVLPVRAWLGQRRALAEAEEQLDVIWRENKRLEDVYDELQTDEMIEQQAREQFGLVKPGELPLSVLPAPAATALPTGWPYDQVQAILWIRTAAAAQPG